MLTQGRDSNCGRYDVAWAQTMLRNACVVLRRICCLQSLTLVLKHTVHHPCSAMMRMMRLVTGSTVRSSYSDGRQERQSIETDSGGLTCQTGPSISGVSVCQLVMAPAAPLGPRIAMTKRSIASATSSSSWCAPRCTSQGPGSAGAAFAGMKAGPFGD